MKRQSLTLARDPELDDVSEEHVTLKTCSGRLRLASHNIDLSVTPSGQPVHI